MVSMNRLKSAPSPARARRRKAFTPERELERSVLNCLLWEDQFYEDGVAIAERIAALVPHVAPDDGRRARASRRARR